MNSPRTTLYRDKQNAKLMLIAQTAMCASTIPAVRHPVLKTHAQMGQSVIQIQASVFRISVSFHQSRT